MKTRLATIALLSTFTLPVMAAGPYPLHELAEKFSFFVITDEAQAKDKQNESVKTDATSQSTQETAIEADTNNIGW